MFLARKTVAPRLKPPGSGCPDINRKYAWYRISLRSMLHAAQPEYGVPSGPAAAPFSRRRKPSMSESGTTQLIPGETFWHWASSISEICGGTFGTSAGIPTSDMRLCLGDHAFKSLCSLTVRSSSCWYSGG
eukprot:2503657-Pyramimonas_sp.AAC.1